MPRVHILSVRIRAYRSQSCNRVHVKQSTDNVSVQHVTAHDINHCLGQGAVHASPALPRTCCESCSEASLYNRTILPLSTFSTQGGEQDDKRGQACNYEQQAGRQAGTNKKHKDGQTVFAADSHMQCSRHRDTHAPFWPYPKHIGRPTYLHCKASACNTFPA